jgi:hypothetical protein
MKEMDTKAGVRNVNDNEMGIEGSSTFKNYG